MKYNVELKPQAIKDLKRIQKSDAARVFDALEIAADGLKGNVKRLTNMTPEYRLRVGNYRVLFEIENGNRIIVYCVIHRKNAYKKHR
jgi:mRNA interferase RelE/StbE